MLHLTYDGASKRSYCRKLIINAITSGLQVHDSDTREKGTSGEGFDIGYLFIIGLTKYLILDDLYIYVRFVFEIIS